MKKIIALAALAAISASASASGNLFVDGSFEEIAMSPGSWGLVSQATLTADEGKKGWTVSAAPGISATNVGLEVRNDVVGTAEDANAKGFGNFIELDGAENDMISQNLKTTIGQQYAITFWYEDRPDLTAKQMKTTGGWKASVGSGADKFTVNFKGSAGTDWVEEEIDFTAVAKSTNFSIWALGTSDGVGTSFDNFQAVAVPEPASLGLFAAGIAVLGFTARRRRGQ